MFHGIFAKFDIKILKTAGDSRYLMGGPRKVPYVPTIPPKGFPSFSVTSEILRFKVRKSCDLGHENGQNTLKIGFSPTSYQYLEFFAHETMLYGTPLTY